MKLAAFPKCFMDQLVVERSMSVFDWIEMAADLPIDGLELYDGFLQTLDEGYLERVRLAMERHHLAMPMLCCSPDFTQPDPAVRRTEITREKEMIDVTVALGGSFCRVLSGQRRLEVSRGEGVRYVVESLRELLEKVPVVKLFPVGTYPGDNHGDGYRDYRQHNDHLEQSKTSNGYLLVAHVIAR